MDKKKKPQPVLLENTKKKYVAIYELKFLNLFSGEEKSNYFKNLFSWRQKSNIDVSEITA